MTDYDASLQTILENYASALQTLDTRYRLGDGLFGFGRKKGDDPCHDVMDKAVEALISRLSEDPEAASQAPDVLRMLLEAESSRSWPDHARWMLVAVQRHAQLLVPLLSHTEAASLADWYSAQYSRAKRFPVQQALLKSLLTRAAAE